MIKRLDYDNYTADQTLTLKISYNLPYQAEEKTFERVNGDFQYKGEFYKLIKQRVANDTLYIVCIRDTQQMKIFNFITDLIKISTDVPCTSSTTKLLNSLIKDYMPTSLVVSDSKHDGRSLTCFDERNVYLCMAVLAIDSPPPESGF